jgi:hypothetical protein
MTELNAATLQLTDEELVRKIEDCTLECEFHHVDHIRLAWIYLRMMPLAEAEVRMAGTLRRYSAHKGKADRYHHTITLAWMRLVAGARRRAPEISAFEEFLTAHPHLQRVGVLSEFYSKDLLASADSRANWIEPDLEPFPT